ARRRLHIARHRVDRRRSTHLGGCCTPQAVRSNFDDTTAYEQWLFDAFDRYSMDRDKDLRDEISEQTSWLATRAARRFADSGEPFDDLCQVARIGLLNAIDRYDPSHGVPFGAYATPTIMGELRRYFRDHTWRVRVSRRAKDLRPAVNATSEELSRELQRSPRIAEIAARMKIAEEAVIEALEANNAYRAHTLDPSGKNSPS